MDEMVEVTSCMERDGRDGGGNKLYGKKWTRWWR